MIVGMNHFTVLTADLARSRDFYVRLLGLRDGPRPDLGFPGAWLYAGERAVLHVIARETLPEPRAGVIDHIAFSATDLPAVRHRLEHDGIAYELRRQRGSGIVQLFCHDPDGAKVELDFDPATAVDAVPGAADAVHPAGRAAG